MGRSYSQDLRLRVLEALEGGMSKMQAHRVFRISRSSIDDWLRLREEQGHVHDKPPRRSSRGALSDLKVFGEFASRHQGATLAQMSVVWEQEHGQKLSLNTFSLALKGLGWTRKKRVSSTPSATKGDELSFSSN
jgi:transposase